MQSPNLGFLIKPMSLQNMPPLHSKTPLHELHSDWAMCITWGGVPISIRGHSKMTPLHSMTPLHKYSAKNFVPKVYIGASKLIFSSKWTRPATLQPRARFAFELADTRFNLSRVTRKFIFEKIYFRSLLKQA